MKVYRISHKAKVAIAGFVAAIAFLCYFIHFCGTSLSSHTSDWGAFGDYGGFALSIVSIALIYITYKEQKDSNKIARFEHHYDTMLNTLADLVEKNAEKLKKAYQKLCRHFRESKGMISDFERGRAANVCAEYYYFISFEDDKLDYIIKYLDTCVSYIFDEASISDEDKSSRITELSCVLPESIRILFFCRILPKINEKFNDKELDYCYQNGLFVQHEVHLERLSEVITYICTGKVLGQTASLNNSVKIDFGYKTNEQFHETYNRLFT